MYGVDSGEGMEDPILRGGGVYGEEDEEEGDPFSVIPACG